LTRRVKNTKIAGLIFAIGLETILANSLSARKRARQSEKNRRQNTGQRSHVRTAIKSVLKALATGDKAAAQAAFKAAVPAIDRSVAKGLMNKNKAARHKSRLNAHVKVL
jgi:small subunit ribosomal protein S20